MDDLDLEPCYLNNTETVIDMATVKS